MSGLVDRVISLISCRDSQKGESLFESLALELFEFQYSTILPYRKLCDRRLVTPSSIESWTQIPAVSTRAFKSFRLFSGDETGAKVFKSSGTSDPISRSKVFFSESGVRLMELAIVTNAAERFFSGGPACRILVLAPDPVEVSESIMSYGMNCLINNFGLQGSRFAISSLELDAEGLLSDLRKCVVENVPAAIVGSSFACLQFLEFMFSRNCRLELPAGSRLLHAGGYKGRTRELDAAAFKETAVALLGIDARLVVNLLGMTELASQVYDVPANGLTAYTSRIECTRVASGLKEPPVWMRTLVVDPRRPDDEQLLNSGAGVVGLLRHFDLANVERPLAIQTEDLAIGWPRTRHAKTSTGCVFEILGRAEKAEPRGCSLSSEDLLICSRAFGMAQ
ncbi:MAG TPA: hypothetical protein VEZ90_17985 [Blastocatellia bacterium]|nr:hypothetical protein [Blastocatellia bacterium]